MLTAVAILLGTARAGAQEDVGHRFPATVGLFGGAQPPVGLYFIDRFQVTRAERSYDASGARQPLEGLRQDGDFDTLGASLTLDLPPLAARMSTAFSVYGGRISLKSDEPPMNRDHAGIGDLWVMPLQLSWRLPHVDLVVDYAFYAPIGGFQHDAPTGGLGTGHWAHEVSFGGAVYFDNARTWSLSALSTFAKNMSDRNIDITPGDVLTLEGGAGKRLLGVLDLGVISFAHWQVSDNEGVDVAAERRTERAQLFAVGAEADVAISAFRTVLTLRFEYDVHAQARLAGETLVAALTFTIWSPKPSEGRPPPRFGR